MEQARAGDPETFVLKELGLSEGDARVDIAVINGARVGFEIKSERDASNRLPSQRRTYARVFDSVTTVVGATHPGRTRRRVPSWGG